MRKVDANLPVLAADTPTKKTRKKPAVVAAPETESVQSRAIVATPSLSPKEEPVVKRVPPKRRMERRSQVDKVGKSTAALSGLVPTGPVAVSANEARKMQERAQEKAAHAPMTPMVSELGADLGTERTLGSLIQAFERRAGLNGLETP